MKKVKRYIVDFKNFVTAVNGLVYDAANMFCRLVVITEITNLVKFAVDSRRELEMHFPFELQEAGLH